MTDGAGCSVRRVVRPQRRYMPSIKEQGETWSRLLSKIDDFYEEACDRFAVRSRPVTFARFLDAGVCVGLLDPVSNIMINTLCSSDLWPDFREKVLVCAVVEKKRDEMGRRSLEGLVAFLVYFFPYLAQWEAVRYLLLADADLLVAARLIVADRGMAGFSLISDASTQAFEEALTLSAQISKHPQPKLLVHVWMLLSSRLHQVLTLLLEVQPNSPRENLDRFKPLLKDHVIPGLTLSWDIAASRVRHNNSIVNMPYQHTRSLRMVLLDTIHGFYLKALARLPCSELRSRLHRSLLKAGYCYGPMDPVSNIILNTIWYDVNFPAAITPVLDVIGPKSLIRLESRSFYGLVSFLQTRYHDLSEHEAVRCLVASCAQLSVADPNLYAAGKVEAEAEAEQQQDQNWLDYRLRQCTSSLYEDAVKKVEKQSPCTGVQEAYAAAATAAWHPNPEEQAIFLASWDVEHGILGDRIMSQLDSKDVQYISSELSPNQQPTPERISKPSYPAIAGKMRSLDQQRRISRKVKAALDRHLLLNGKPKYDLHTICCVNEQVCGPEYCEDMDDPLSFAPCKYRYSHVNFLATQKGSLFSAYSYPVLFFAEFDNEEEEGAPLFCCQVDEPIPFADHVRCLYCEAAGARVVHPTLEGFHGRGRELEEVICGEHNLDNDRLICKNEYAVQRLCSVEEDFMFVDVK